MTAFIIQNWHQVWKHENQSEPKYFWNILFQYIITTWSNWVGVKISQEGRTTARSAIWPELCRTIIIWPLPYNILQLKLIAEKCDQYIRKRTKANFCEMLHILGCDQNVYNRVLNNSVLDCGRARGGDLHRTRLRVEGGWGEAAQPRPRECHRPHDVSRWAKIQD